MKQLIPLLVLSCVAFSCVSMSAGTLFSGSYPNVVLVIDEAQGKVVDTIKLETGLPTSIRLSQDKKTLFVSTNDHTGIEIIDVATHKVLNHFVLNDATHKYRMQGGAPDPEGKLVYTTTTQITKLSDRYEIGKAKYTIIDLAKQKIVKSVDQPNEIGAPGDPAVAGGGGGGGRGGGGFEVSPDGKFLYQFGASVRILKADDFSLVETIALEQPDSPVESLTLGGLQEALSDPAQRVSLFNYTDPIVHNRVFGLATFDLNKRKFDFKAIGPSPATMTNLHVAPDKKEAYTVTSTGLQGNKRCEFWAIDIATSKLARTAEVPCRTRFSFGLSSNGKKLYMYGAGYEIEVYDAVTFKREAVWDLGHDMTGGGLVALP